MILPFARIAAVLAALAVVTGALGAHLLQAQLAGVDPKATGWWETAAHYHLIHAVALFAIGLTGQARLSRAWWTMFSGMILFSGSLYLMALTGNKALPIVIATPLGGILMIAGWIQVAIAYRRPD